MIIGIAIGFFIGVLATCMAVLLVAAFSTPAASERDDRDFELTVADPESFLD